MKAKICKLQNLSAKKYSTIMHTADALVENTEEGRTWLR